MESNFCARELQDSDKNDTILWIPNGWVDGWPEWFPMRYKMCLSLSEIGPWHDRHCSILWKCPGNLYTHTRNYVYIERHRKIVIFSHLMIHDSKNVQNSVDLKFMGIFHLFPINALSSRTFRLTESLMKDKCEKAQVNRGVREWRLKANFTKRQRRSKKWNGMLKKINL